LLSARIARRPRFLSPSMIDFLPIVADRKYRCGAIRLDGRISIVQNRLFEKPRCQVSITGEDPGLLLSGTASAHQSDRHAVQIGFLVRFVYTAIAVKICSLVIRTYPDPGVHRIFDDLGVLGIHFSIVVDVARAFDMMRIRRSSTQDQDRRTDCDSKESAHVFCLSMDRSDRVINQILLANPAYRRILLEVEWNDRSLDRLRAFV